DQLVPTPELARQTRVPSNYLAKVLQQLAAANLIRGRRGVGGGYRLTRPASQITLMDVVGAMGDLKRIETCPLGLPNHGANPCPLHRRLDEATARVIETFNGVTLQHLVSDGQSNLPLCDAEATARLTISAQRA